MYQDGHMVCMFTSVMYHGVHVMYLYDVLWCVCGVHVVFVWCMCGVHVVCMWCSCGVQES